MSQQYYSLCVNTLNTLDQRCLNSITVFVLTHLTKDSQQYYSLCVNTLDQRCLNSITVFVLTHLTKDVSTVLQSLC